MGAHFRSAYEEALIAQGLDGEDTTSPSLMPSYMVAADTHNIANGNQTFLESASDSISNIPKFVGLSLISGVNQLYNAPASIGNMLGGDFDVSGPDDFIQGLDSDLGRYYQKEKENIDLVGFLASSWIPGMAGVKALHAGQAALKASMNANKAGFGSSKALGLLVPNKQLSLNKAIREAVNGENLPSLINRNVMRAAGAGLTQATYEAAFFEAAVAITMSSSPILEGQDLGDFVTNIAWGAGLFGVASGGVGAVKSYYATRRAASDADKASSPWRYSNVAASASNPYEAIALDLQELKTTPNVPAGGLIIGDVGKRSVIDPATLAAMGEAKVKSIENNIRLNVGKIANKDDTVADTMYDAFLGSSHSRRMGGFIGMKGVSRMADKLILETEVAALTAKTKALAPDAIQAANRLASLQVKYMRTWGPRSKGGELLTEPPPVTSVVDTLRKGQAIKVTPSKGVTAGKTTWKFSLSKPWNILEESPIATNARYLWVASLPPIAKSLGRKKPFTVSETDIPLMEKVYKEFDPRVQVRDVDGDIKTFSSAEDFMDNLIKVKEEVAGRRLTSDALQSAKDPKFKSLVQEEIESMSNLRSGYMTGERSQDIMNDVFALDSYAAEYTQSLVEKGARKLDKGVVDLKEVPQTMKIAYDSKDLTALTEGHVIENMTRIKQQQKLYTDNLVRVTNSVLGPRSQDMIDWTADKIQDSANRLGAGAGGATAASSNPGSLAADAEYTGKLTLSLIEDAKAKAREVLDPVLFKLGSKPEAAIEYATLSNTLRSIPDKYTFNEAGTALVPTAIKRWEAAAADAQALGKTIPERPVLTAMDTPLEIAIKNKEVIAMFKADLRLNGETVDKYRQLRTAQGMQYTRDTESIYPVPVDPKEYKHFALVTDNSVTGTGHVKTLYASSAEDLKAMGAKLAKNPTLQVDFKADIEDFYKSKGQFEFEKTMSDNYLDAAMYRSGVSSSYFVPTYPKKIVDDALNWHMQRQSGLVREAVSARYEIPFAELRRLGDRFTKAETSQFSSISTLKYAEEVIQNPYADFIKTALGVRKYSDYPLLVEPNKYVDRAFSKMYDKVTGVWKSAKSDADLDQINTVLRESGYRGAAYDIESELFANTVASKAKLTSAVRTGNSIIATVVLRWDQLNAVNNAVSANVLLATETRSIIKAIESSDARAIGKLSELTRISVPGTDRSIFAAGKMIAKSIGRFQRSGSDMDFYRKHGYISSISDQYRKTLDDVAFNPAESAGTYSSRISAMAAGMRETANKAGDFGEMVTGNRLAEEFNRFVAADVMKQLTDIAVDSKLITKQEQLAHINTFVNRTQGNYLAAQRPMMFQGPIGQAVGLFQTYQFNLMQQLFRHVGEGASKDAMTLLAMQGSIHGMNGLPAFNAINTAIVGNASGNEQHRDVFDATYGVVGKQAGNWLLYGMASNMLIHPDLKVNLYTRGDINPRHLTIIPTDPSQLPIIQATGKVFANLFETAAKLGAGGDVVNTILQGIEHNGVSRPLAGLAQTLEGLANPLGQSYSTSKRGNVIAANDLFSLVNLGRIVGGKPLDEAIALDASFRFKTYGIGDQRKRQLLGEAIKTTMIAGGDPTTEQIDAFAESYAAAGGKSEQFNSWFIGQYKNANLSQVNKLAQSLSSPFAKGMQRVMGGNELRDFTNQ